MSTPLALRRLMLVAERVRQLRVAPVRKLRTT
jgi:hypothetical protein